MSEELDGGTHIMLGMLDQSIFGNSGVEDINNKHDHTSTNNHYDIEYTQKFTVKNAVEIALLYSPFIFAAASILFLMSRFKSPCCRLADNQC